MINLEPIQLFKHCPKCGKNNLEIIETNAIKCKDCHFVYFFNASGAVIAIITNHKNELLVTKRTFEPFKGKLDLPGGFIMPGESAEEALKRELKEELNIEIEKMNYCYSLPNKYPYSGLIVNTIDFIFKASIKSFDQMIAGDDVSEFFFVDANNIRPEDFGVDSVRKAVIGILETLNAEQIKS